MINRSIRFLLLILPLLVPSVLFSQSNFTPLEKGDYEIVEEKILFNPGVQVGGFYRAYSTSKRDGLSGEEEFSQIAQEIGIKIESKINTNVKVHALLQNKLSLVDNQEPGYTSDKAYEQQDSTTDDGMAVVFKEAYLEYNHNPRAILKLGRHAINPADRKGLIYKGVNTGVSQDCSMGTWCTYAGGARLGTYDAIYWAQLDYPVFFNDIMIQDLWEGERQQSSLNIELFRLIYMGLDTPLAPYGGAAVVNSPYQARDNDELVYFDALKTEYEGFNINWNYHDLLFELSYIMLYGKRKYHVGSQSGSNTYRSLDSTQKLNGRLVNIDINYQFTDNWRFGYSFMSSSGNKVSSPNENFWEKNSAAYFEIQKGSFGDALFYLNGIENMGEGHSISNLIYRSYRFSYRDSAQDFVFDINYYHFKRAESVYNEFNNRVSEIGTELDLLLSFNLEKQLLFQSYVSLFRMGDAYAVNDSMTPGDNDKEAYQIGLNLEYNF
jgi:hypothetical protein